MALIVRHVRFYRSLAVNGRKATFGHGLPTLPAGEMIGGLDPSRTGKVTSLRAITRFGRSVVVTAIAMPRLAPPMHAHLGADERLPILQIGKHSPRLTVADRTAGSSTPRRRTPRRPG